MSIDPFPERVTPRKLCNSNGSINSIIPLDKFLRFGEYLHDNQGQAEVFLRFDRDEAGHCFIDGTVKADVSMICQRCLKATPVALESAFEIKVADSDGEAGRLAQGGADQLGKLETVICDDGEIDLLSLVEDELILSLPIVASHEDENCSKMLNTLHDESGEFQRTQKGSIKGLEELEALRQELKQNSDKTD